MNTPNIEKLLVRYYNDELPFDQTARGAAWIGAGCGLAPGMRAAIAAS